MAKSIYCQNYHDINAYRHTYKYIYTLKHGAETWRI